MRRETLCGAPNCSRVKCNKIGLQWLIYSLYCNQYITSVAVRVLLILPSFSALECTRICQLEKEEGGFKQEI